MSLILRTHTDSDGVVTDLIVMTHLSFMQNFPPTLQHVEGPVMAETLLSRSGRQFQEFHFYRKTILKSVMRFPIFLPNIKILSCILNPPINSKMFTANLLKLIYVFGIFF